jgi:hypothetical protein
MPDDLQPASPATRVAAVEADQVGSLGNLSACLSVLIRSDNFLARRLPGVPLGVRPSWPLPTAGWKPALPGGAMIDNGRLRNPLWRINYGEGVMQ